MSHHFQFDLPSGDSIPDTLSGLADTLCLFTDVFALPEQGMSDALTLSAAGADGASIILTSVEQGLRELATNLRGGFRSDRETWQASHAKWAAYNAISRYLVQYLDAHSDHAEDLVAFLHTALAGDFTAWETLTASVTGEEGTV